MKYDDLLPYYYNNNQKFLQKRLDKKIIKDSKIFEKVEIKWFSFDDIKRNHNKFRSFYKNVIHLILGNKSGIEDFVKKSFVKGNKTKSKTKSKRKNSNKTRKH
jgi:hypothetical protein